jgi:D-alanyl-D-alanine carboxypeptidase
MEDSTNTILYAKNMDQILYPSSAVKIMTCLLVLENCALTDEVTMTATGVSGVTDGGASISAQLGEVFTVEQCLYAIMLASANDIALQVAEHVSGSVDAFVERMNTRAVELGCTNTVFANPTGLPNDSEHTTAHDLALITKAAMSNETFRTISGTTSYTIPATNVSGGERVLSGKFTMTDSSTDAFYEGCIGGKEGYTSASGSVLACAAQRNGTTLICVVMQGASGQTDDEAITLLDYGFSNFQKMDLGETDFDISSGGIVTVPAGTSEDSITFEDTTGEEQISRQYLYNGTPVGTAVVEIQQQEDDSITADSEANIQEALDYTQAHTNIPYYVIGGVAILLLILLLIRMILIIRS